MIMYHKNIFGFSSIEKLTHAGSAHLITGSYIKKDENMWLMGIPLNSFAQLEF